MTTQRVLQGDVRAVLATLEPESVNCVVTSPPYWGLRRYEGVGEDGIGLEPTVDLYIEHLVEVFEAVRRVLRSDGVMLVNLGDSYANDGKWGGSTGGKHVSALHGQTGVGRGRRHTGLKPKDLCLVPERFALAMQAAGWYVRDRIAWVKKAPMPESVHDRCTRSWEHIWMFTKSPHYWWDAEAVREKQAPATVERGRYGWQGRTDDRSNGASTGSSFQDMPSTMGESKLTPADGRRNLRNAWVLGPDPLGEIRANGKSYKHYAAFPSAIPRRAILAACPPYVCPTCRKPWVRLIDKTFVPQADVSLERGVKGAPGQKQVPDNHYTGTPRGSCSVATLGWASVCSCDLSQDACVPGLVLDPFAGSGTSLLVARELGREGIGVELSPHYCEMAEHRLGLVQPPMLPVTAL